MTPLSRARRLAGWWFVYWGPNLGRLGLVMRGDEAASLALDGYPARWPRTPKGSQQHARGRPPPTRDKVLLGRSNPCEDTFLVCY